MFNCNTLSFELAFSFRTVIVTAMHAIDIIMICGPGRGNHGARCVYARIRAPQACDHVARCPAVTRSARVATREGAPAPLDHRATRDRTGWPPHSTKSAAAADVLTFVDTSELRSDNALDLRLHVARKRSVGE